MIRRANQYPSEVRHEMRGGSGDVVVEYFWRAGDELKAPCRMQAKLTLPVGASIGFHRHDGEEETFVIIAGRAELDEDGVKTTLEPGDSSLTGNAGHSLRNIGDTDLVVFAVINTHAAAGA